jgi:ribosomal protein S27AE
MAKNKMICPKCGAEMNHHAMKIDYSHSQDEWADAIVEGGVVQEVHTCPNCHLTEFRPGDES